MNFWHIQLHPNDQAGWPPERIRKILMETHYIGMGDDIDEGKIEQFWHELDIGDVVAVKNGTIPIALVEVTGEKEDTTSPNKELDWFPLRRKIKILDFYKDNYSFHIPQPRGTFSKCADLNAETSKVIVSWFNRIKQDKAMNDLRVRLKKEIGGVLAESDGQINAQNT